MSWQEIEHYFQKKNFSQQSMGKKVINYSYYVLNPRKQDGPYSLYYYTWYIFVNYTICMTKFDSKFIKIIFGVRI